MVQLKETKRAAFDDIVAEINRHIEPTEHVLIKQADVDIFEGSGYQCVQYATEIATKIFHRAKSYRAEQSMEGDASAEYEEDHYELINLWLSKEFSSSKDLEEASQLSGWRNESFLEAS